MTTSRQSWAERHLNPRALREHYARVAALTDEQRAYIEARNRDWNAEAEADRYQREIEA